MNKITFSSFFSKYILHPTSNELSRTDRIICTIASCALALLTLGLLHIGLTLYQRSRPATGHSIDFSDKALCLKNQIKETIAKLREIQTRLDDINRLEELLDLMFNHSLALLSDCTSSNDLQELIMGNIESELETLASTAQKLLEAGEDISPASQNLTESLNLAKWIDDILLLIVKGKKHWNSNYLSDLQKLLEQKNNVNTPISPGQKGTVLHSLAKYGKPVPFVEMFAKYGADFNLRDYLGNTPLLWAIANGNNTIAAELLNYPHDLSITGYGNSALHLAVVKGYKDRTADGAKLTVSNKMLIAKMVENGADPNQLNSDGFSALHLACARRDPEMIEILLNADADLSLCSTDGRCARDFLKIDYAEAKEIMASVTGPYLLLEAEFNANYQLCRSVIRNHTP